MTREPADEARPFLQQNPLPFPVLYDRDGKVAETFGLGAIPLILAVDRKGTVTARFEGFTPAGFQTEFVPQVEQMLAN